MNKRLHGIDCVVHTAHTCLFTRSDWAAVIGMCHLPLLPFVYRPVSCVLSGPPLPRRAEATQVRKLEPQILMPRYLIHRHTERQCNADGATALLDRRDISEYEDREVPSDPSAVTFRVFFFFFFTPLAVYLTTY